MRAIRIPEERAAAMRATAAAMCEKQRRQYLAREARLLGYGGIAAVARATGTSPATIRRGVREIDAGDLWERGGRVRAPGGGRKTVLRLFDEFIGARGDPDAERDLLAVTRATVGDRCYGDPTGEGRPHSNLTAQGLADELRARTGFSVSERTAHRLLVDAGFTLQRNRKLDQVGPSHPLRNVQFMLREETVLGFNLTGLPVASVDAKARLNLGNFAANGAEWMEKGSPRRALDHDFPLPWTAVYPDGNPLMPPEVMACGLAVAVLYGVYVKEDNSAHCVVGIGPDSSEFACNSLVAWWEAIGCVTYAGADEILVLADCGGSNRCDGYLYKYELALAVRRMGLASATVLHLPPGTSKYNPIEHRLWGPVSTNWRAKPMRTLEEVAAYVSSTTNSGGLSVSCEVDYRRYLTESAKREARRAAGLPAGPTPKQLFDEIAVVERPFPMNAALSRWTYQIVLV